MYRVDVRGELFSRFTMGFYRLLSLFFLKFCAASGSPALIYKYVVFDVLCSPSASLLMFLKEAVRRAVLLR